ncbi:hypothetical protein GEMRC1_008242 [Eukaryota sp. GEM-RC1]
MRLISPEFWPTLLLLLPSVVPNDLMFRGLTTLYGKTQHPTHKKHLISALGSISDVKVMHHVFDWSLVNVPLNNLVFLLSSSSKVNPVETRKFFLQKYEFFKSTSGGLFLLGNLIAAAGRYLEDEESVSTIDDMLSQDLNPSERKSLVNLRDTCVGRLKLRTKVFGFLSFLTSYYELGHFV